MQTTANNSTVHGFGVEDALPGSDAEPSSGGSRAASAGSAANGETASWALGSQGLGALWRRSGRALVGLMVGIFAAFGAFDGSGGNVGPFWAGAAQAQSLRAYPDTLEVGQDVMIARFNVIDGSVTSPSGVTNTGSNGGVDRPAAPGQSLSVTRYAASEIPEDASGWTEVPTTPNTQGPAVMDNDPEAFGELTMDSSGNAVFTLSAEASNLRRDNSRNQTFWYEVSDGTNTDRTYLFVYVVGRNDSPVISRPETVASPYAGSVTEAGGVDNASRPTGPSSATGFAMTDPDGIFGGAFQVGVGASPDNFRRVSDSTDTFVGSYGSLTVGVSEVAREGGRRAFWGFDSWSYELDQDNADVQALTANDRDALTDTFSVRFDDGSEDLNNPDQRYSNVETITITISGANDSPIISTPIPGRPYTGSVTEAGGKDNANPPAGPSSSTGFTVTDPEGTESGKFQVSADGGASYSDVDVALASTSFTGTYGTLTVASTANTPSFDGWSYALDQDNTAVEALTASDRDALTETFSVRFDDGWVLSSSPYSNVETITIKISGANDSPTISRPAGVAPYAGSVTEAGGVGNANRSPDPSRATGFDVEDVEGTVIGSFQVSVDGGSRYSDLDVTRASSSFAGSYGTLTVASTANAPSFNSWSYELEQANPDVQALFAGSPILTDTFSVRFDDRSGLTNHPYSNVETITIRISGADDVPTISRPGGVAPYAVSVKEAGGIANAIRPADPSRTTGFLVTDVEGRASRTFQVSVDGGSSFSDVEVASASTSFTGTYGTLTVASTANTPSFNGWSYALDQDNTAVEALAASDRNALTDSFRVRYDGRASDPETRYSNMETITITISGANDSPVISLPSGVTAGAAAAYEATVLEAGGSNNANPPAGPGSATGFAVEDSEGASSGKFQVAAGTGPGLDYSNVKRYSTAFTGSYGTLTVRSTGGMPTFNSWSYSLDQDNTEVEALNVGSPALSDTFSVRFDDGSGPSNSPYSNVETIRITIDGANDAPIISRPDGVAPYEGSVTEAGGIGNADAPAGPGSATGFSVSDQDGCSGIYVFQVAADPGTGASLAYLGVTGGSTAFAGSYGTLTIGGTYRRNILHSVDSWSYELDQDNTKVEALTAADRDALTEYFSVRLVDGCGAFSNVETIAISISGANDAPVISRPSGVAPYAGSVTEAGGKDNANPPAGISSSTGFAVTDPEGTGSGKFQVSFDGGASYSDVATAREFTRFAGSYGTLTVANASGMSALNGWSYALDQDNTAVEALTASDRDALTETFRVRFDAGPSDPSAQYSNVETITITISGANDSPTISRPEGVAPYVVSVMEAGGVGNTVAGTDAETTTGYIVTDAEGAAYGRFQVSVDGGGKYSEVNVRLLSTSFTGAYGTLTVASTANTPSFNSWSYRLDQGNAAVEALPGSARNALRDTFSVRFDDGSGGTNARYSNVETIEILISGAYDAPVISRPFGVAPYAGSVSEAGGRNNANPVAGPRSATGFAVTDPEGYYLGRFQVSVDGGSGYSDVNVGNTSTSFAGSYGTLTVALSGLTQSFNGWSYALDQDNTAVEALTASDRDALTETFRVRFDSRSSHSGVRYSNVETITIAISGANDSPVLSLPSGVTAGAAAAYEATVMEAGGDDNANPPAGPNSATGFVVTDAEGVSSGKFQVAAGVGSNLYYSSVTGSSTAFIGSYGYLTVGSTEGAPTFNSWSYALYQEHDAVEALNADGPALTETFSVRFDDGSGDPGTRYSNVETIAITISGANDAPVISRPDGAAPYAGFVTEAGGIDNADTPAGPSSATGFLVTDQDGCSGIYVFQVAAGNDTDADANLDYFDVTGSSTAFAGSYGTLAVGGAYRRNILHAIDSWSYALDQDNADVEALTAEDRYALTETFSVRLMDGCGSFSNVETITIGISGANDAPTPPSRSLTVGENDAMSGEVRLVVNDRSETDYEVQDADDNSVFFTRVWAGTATDGPGARSGESARGKYGTLTVTSEGVATYVPDPNDARLQALKSATATDTFVYEVRDREAYDPTVLTGTAELVVTINPVNDAPVAGAPKWSFEILDSARTVASGLLTGLDVRRGASPAEASSDQDDGLSTLVVTHFWAASATDVTQDGVLVATVAGDARAAGAGAVLIPDFGKVTIGRDGSVRVFDLEIAVYDLVDMETRVAGIDFALSDGVEREALTGDGGAPSWTGTLELTVTRGFNQYPGVKVGAFITPPSGANMPVVGQEWEYVTGDLRDVFEDPDGDTLTYGAVATVRDEPQSWVRVAADPNQPSGLQIFGRPSASLANSELNIVVTATDGIGGSTPARLEAFGVAIQSPGENQRPVANPDTLSISEDSVSGIVNVIVGNANGAGRDTGPDESSLTVRRFSLDAGAVTPAIEASSAVMASSNESVAGEFGRLRIAGDGVATYTLLPKSRSLATNENEVFAYEITDAADGSVAVATLTVTIAGQNDVLKVGNAIGRRVFRTAAGETVEVTIPRDAFVDPESGTKPAGLTYTVEVKPDGKTAFGPVNASFLSFDPEPASGEPTISGRVGDGDFGTHQVRVTAQGPSQGVVAPESAAFTFELVIAESSGSNSEETDPVGPIAVSSVSWSVIDAIRAGLAGSSSSTSEGRTGFDGASGAGLGVSLDVDPMVEFFYAELERGPGWQAEDARAHRARAVSADRGSVLAGAAGAAVATGDIATAFGEMLDGAPQNRRQSATGAAARGHRTLRVWANARRGAIQRRELENAAAAGFSPDGNESRTFGLGFDAALGDGLGVGVALAQSGTEAGFRETGGVGAAETADGTTGSASHVGRGSRTEARQLVASPYVTLSRDRARHWAAIGLGQGEFSFSGERRRGVGDYGRGGTVGNVGGVERIEDGSGLSLRMAAAGSDFNLDLLAVDWAEALGRVEALASNITLDAARGGAYARQDASLVGLRGQLEIGMPVGFGIGVGDARIRPNLTLGYRWESGKAVIAGRGSSPASIVNLDARAYELGAGASLDTRDMEAELGVRSSLRGEGIAAGPVRYSLSITHDRARDGLGTVMTLDAATLPAGPGMDPFSQSALDPSGIAAVAVDEADTVTATARVGYGLDLGRGNRLSAYALAGRSSVTIGVEREGETSSTRLTYGSTASSPTATMHSGAEPRLREALGVDFEIGF